MGSRGCVGWCRSIKSIWVGVLEVYGVYGVRRIGVSMGFQGSGGVQTLPLVKHYRLLGYIMIHQNPKMPDRDDLACHYNIFTVRNVVAAR